MHKIKTFFKARWAFFIGLVFVWIVPLIMLSESAAMIKEVSTGIKITWVGCVALVILAFSFRKFVYGQIIRLKHGVLRAILKCLYKAISCALIVFILAYLGSFADCLYSWWLKSCVSIFIGLCFYFYDELRASKFDKQNREDEIKAVLVKEKEKENG